MRRILPLLLVCLLLAPNAWADSKAEARRYFQAGMALIDQGKYREGVESLLKAYEIRPHRNVLFNIARAYASWGRVDDAIIYFERYLETDPPDAARIRSTLEELRLRVQLRTMVEDGMGALRQKRYAEGIALLTRAYEQRPHPNILFNIAKAYEDSGDTMRAIATYRQYLRSGPRDATEVEARLRSLETSEAVAARPRVEPPRKRPTPPPPAPPPPRKKPGKEDEPVVEVQAPPTAVMDDAQMDRLAELMINRLKAEGAFDRPEPVVVTETVPAPITEAALPTPVLTSTTSESVALEAKGGEVYEQRVVTASRREQSPLDAPNAVTILTEEDIRLSGARTIPDLLRRVPGMDVMAMSYSDYNVAMRGFNRRVANKILVLVDGRTVYQDFLGGTLWRTLSIDLIDIERIEVVRGPGSAIYGAYAYTGIINIITKRPDQVNGSTVQASGGNGKRVEAAYQYGLRKGPLGVRISGGYERGDKYALEFDPERVDFTSNVEDVEKSLDGARADLNAEYNFSETSRLFLGGGVRSGFTEFYGIANIRNQAIDSLETSLRGGYEGELLTLRSFWNRLEVQSTPQFYRRGTDDLGSVLRFDLISVEPIFRPEFELGGQHALVLGGEWRHKFINWDYLNDQQTEDHFALFFQDTWTLNEAFSVIASARLDLHPIIGPLGSPRVALIYKPTARQAVRLSAGTAFRSPTLAETYLDLSASTPVTGVAVTLQGGQSALDPEAIATIDIGYRLETDIGEFEAVGYFNRVSNLITRTPLERTGVDQGFRPDIGAFVGAVSRYVNDPRVFFALGSELSARVYPIDGVDIGANYALQYIFDSETGDRFTDSPLHKFNIWAQLRTRFGLDAGLSLHVVSAQKWAEPNYDPAAPSGFNVDPLPVDASILVIGRLGYRLLEDQLEVAVSGTNLLDFGDLRHREHPYANELEARILGSVTARF